MRYFEKITLVDENGREMLSFTRELADMVVSKQLAMIKSDPANDDLVPRAPDGKGVAVDGARQCSKCGNYGHIGKTCGTSRMRASFSKPQDVPKVEPITVEDVKRMSPVPEEIPPEPPKRSASEERGEIRLSEAEFKRVRFYHHREGRNSLWIVEQMGLPMQQVNYAMLCSTYDAYRKQYDRP